MISSLNKCSLETRAQHWLTSVVAVECKYINVTCVWVCTVPTVCEFHLGFVFML